MELCSQLKAPPEALQVMLDSEQCARDIIACRIHMSLYNYSKNPVVVLYREKNRNAPITEHRCKGERDTPGADVGCARCLTCITSCNIIQASFLPRWGLASR